MIKLHRQLDTNTFPPSFTGEKRIAWSLELLQQAREKKQGTRKHFQFIAARWKETKENLKNESHKKCAYCESYFSTVAYGDVEHYRPKSIYWWLAYAYFNYAASCQLCNQKYKSNRFPTLNTALKEPKIRRNNNDAFLTNLAKTTTCDPLNDADGLAFQDFLNLHEQERPLSIDPYVDDPKHFFAYEYDDVLREVILVPISDDKRDLVLSCIRLFGLNRKELREMRYRKLLDYRFYRDIINNPRDERQKQGAINLIKRNYTSPTAEYSGMYQYFEGKSIAPIPDFSGENS